VDSDEHVSEEGAAEGSTLVPEGTVLFVVRGMSLAKEFRVGVACRPVTFNQDVRGIIPDRQVDPRYLGRFLLWASTAVLSRADTASHGTMRLHSDDLQQIVVPLPPFEEQKRIALILDKADGIRWKRREVGATIGSLVDSVFVEMFGQVVARKSPWPIRSFRDFLTAANGKSARDVLTKEPTGIPVYGGNGVNGWASQSLYDEPIIVVGRVGQQCGITHMTPGPSWVTDNAIAVRIRDKSKILPEYLEAALVRSSLGHDVRYIDLPFINQQMILDLPLPLPPIDRQLEFARRKSALQKLREKSEQCAEESNHLFDSLIQRAFQGKL
jgi:type I restriction enzyme S subunit